MSAGAITLGPVLFNWAPETWRDFYVRIADEAPVATVYLGEVVCSKRAPLFEPLYAEVAERLRAAGKTVVLSTLSQVMVRHDRQLVEGLCVDDATLVEANDACALYRLRGRPHHVGPFVNTYNEGALAVLARGGARNICVPPEMPARAIRVLCEQAARLAASIEVLVFGRIPLALSARCYHARAHGRTKDSCQFVCENDADGLTLRTLEDNPFLTVNGTQVLSHEYLGLVHELPALQAMGVGRFRLSPHSCDMVGVAMTFRALLDCQIAVDEATARLESLAPGAPFSNGFYHAGPGRTWRPAAR